MPERRRHVVYVTRNTEYHCRDRECVGVRDRRTGTWSHDHPALRAAVMGSVLPDRRAVRAQPRVGLRLVLGSRRSTMLTTSVLFAGRPAREDIFSYTSLCRAGVIGG